LVYGRHPAITLATELAAQVERVRYLPKLGDRTSDPAAEIDRLRSVVEPLAYILDFTDFDSPVLEAVPVMRSSGARVWMSPLWPGLAGSATDDRAVDHPDANWGRLLDLGANMLCTDRPAELIDYLNAKQRRLIDHSWREVQTTSVTNSSTP